MKFQEFVPLSNIYNREEDFSAELGDNLDALKVGDFEDVEIESNVGRREADIVALGEDGILVVENQFGKKGEFGKANWDHWGRLEAYARLNEATVAVLVAEGFEDLMIETCRLRNEESEIDWYLIQAQANSHKEFFFQHIVRPMSDIQVERKTSTEYSEFWGPIREQGLFAGKQVPINTAGAIGKTVKGVRLTLQLRKHRCYVQLSFQGENRLEHRKDIVKLFPKPQYDYHLREAPKSASVTFPVLDDKGKEDREDWDEVREALVAKGTEVYNKIYESDI